MNCNAAERLLHAFADGELDLKDSIAVEEHLGACAVCRRSFAGVEAARAAIERHVAKPPAPDELRRRLEFALAPATVAGRVGALLRSPLAIAAPGIVALLVAGWLLIGGVVREPVAAQNVVYHISNSDSAGAALRSLSNHLNAAPGVKVVVVAHNKGVDFLLRGARDETGMPFEASVREFGRRGVEFRVCHNTLERRGIAATQVIPGAALVPSGIAEIGRLQGREGYAYMRL